VKKNLTKMQKVVLGLAIVPMIAVGAAGGKGTYSNLSGAYGSGTATGALAAGEGATAVLALLMLGLTMLGQAAPAAIRIGLWALPGAAAVMAATAAHGTGQTIVYALTPMAITASAEGLAFLVRRIVVHQEGRDAEAEARDARIVRDLAYQQARAASHPKEGVRRRSELRAWKLARKVGTGDVGLGARLVDVQRERLTQGADVALTRMFTPGTTAGTAPALPGASADTPPALLPGSAHDATDSGARDVTIQAETSGYPAETTPEQQEEGSNVRPGLSLVRAAKEKTTSIAADVRQMVDGGVSDVRVVMDAIATRHGRSTDDPKFRQTVSRTFRKAMADAADTTDDADTRTGQYL
jgi:hypothetical protein